MNTARPFAPIEPLEARIAPAALNLAALNGADGLKVVGEDSDGRAGWSVSDGGDVNGDGYGDVIIGTRDFTNVPTPTYVVFGKAGGFSASLDLSALDGTNGFEIRSLAPGSAASRGPVSTGGDVNGDGYDDIIIGGTGVGIETGYVVFGKASGFAATVDLSTLNGSDGFKIQGGPTVSRLGNSVSGAGDVNGDGFDDVIISGYLASPGSPAAYVIFGKASGFGATMNTSTIDGTNGFALLEVAANDKTGFSVSGAGDVNGDGFDDVIVGAYGADTNGSYSGTSYVVLGKGSGFSATLALSGLDGTNGFALHGESAGDRSGWSVSDAGDVNGDGYDDVIIGAPKAEANGSLSGASYVVYGKASGFSAGLNLSALNGTNGFKLEGVAAGDYAGQSVSGAGDVNGDGFDDVIIGTWGRGAFTSEVGATYVVFGRASGFNAPFDLALVNGANGFKTTGGTGAFPEISVSSAGDVNNDGFDDFIVGAPYTDTTNVFNPVRGAAFIVFGKASALTPAFSADFKTATFSDVDGDLVTVKTTAGTFDATNFTISPLADPYVFGGQFSRLDLSDAEFAGANITITAKRSVAFGGDGLVNLGFLDATGVNLGVVSLKGDLGRFAIGDGTGPSATSLTVSSLGAYGTSTQLGITPSLTSTAAGLLSLLTVNGDVGGVTVEAPSYGTVKIIGDLENSTINATAGGMTAFSAGDVFSSYIFTTGAVGSITPGATAGSYTVAGGIKINGDVFGTQIETGSSGSGITSLISIAGDVIDSYLYPLGGGGSIAPGATPGSVKLNGGIFIGGGLSNSSISTALTADVATLSIKGGIDGGPTGVVIDLPGDLGAFTVGHTVRGLTMTVEGDLTSAVFSGGVIDSQFVIHGDIGSIAAGTTVGTYKLGGGLSIKGNLRNTTIDVEGDLSKLTVMRSILSSTVSVRGDAGPTDELAAQTIGAISVTGRVFDSDILAGHLGGNAHHGEVQIGKVAVGRAWIASNLVAGVAAGDDEIFGTADDLAISTGAIASKIASVIIGGHVRGTAGGVDAFGFVAQEVASFSASATTIPLTLGASNNLTGFALGSTFDTRVREVA